jgi:hypothetical protein
MKPMLLGALLACAAAAAQPRLYEMSTETGMPHLDESLRYAVVRERRCLDPHALQAAFWMLGHESLQGCRLEKMHEDAAAASYLLACDGNRGTSGGAQWQLGERQLRGTLNVRLGGKNMTFHQRIVATPVGDCATP